MMLDLFINKDIPTLYAGRIQKASEPNSTALSYANNYYSDNFQIPQEYYYIYQDYIDKSFFPAISDNTALFQNVEGIIAYLLNNESFNIIDDKETINELLVSLELDRLDILKKFLTELSSEIESYGRIKKINLKITPSDGDINNFGLSFIFNEDENFDKINAFLCKINELKRDIDEAGFLWFIDIGVKF